MGDIQLSFYDRKGVLEVEVIRARGLLPKPGSKILPGKWIRVFDSLCLYRMARSILNCCSWSSDKECFLWIHCYYRGRTWYFVFLDSFVFAISFKLVFVHVKVKNGILAGILK